ncbi:hypothetical protein N0V86_008788 [Didymella sp. IMI 355093]|nr:hypothetical protein N0V86_008788 [Didymella sp. IMI 355093]
MQPVTELQEGYAGALGVGVELDVKVVLGEVAVLDDKDGGKVDASVGVMEDGTEGLGVAVGVDADKVVDSRSEGVDDGMPEKMEEVEEVEEMTLEGVAVDADPDEVVGTKLEIADEELAEEVERVMVEEEPTSDEIDETTLDVVAVFDTVAGGEDTTGVTIAIAIIC